MAIGQVCSCFGRALLLWSRFRPNDRVKGPANQAAGRLGVHRVHEDRDGVFRLGHLPLRPSGLSDPLQEMTTQASAHALHALALTPDGAETELGLCRANQAHNPACSLLSGPSARSGSFSWPKRGLVECQARPYCLRQHFGRFRHF